MGPAVEGELDAGRPSLAGIAFTTTLALAALLAAFSPSLTAGFVSWDDVPGLLENPKLQGAWADFLPWAWSSATMGHWQPLSWLSLRADFSGTATLAESAHAVHRTNLALHALTTLLVGCIAWRLLACSRPQQARSLPNTLAVALFAALAWGLHPLRVESVAWATERRDVLSGALIAAATLAWLHWRSGGAPPSKQRGGSLAALCACSTIALGLAFVALELPTRAGAALRMSHPLALSGATAALGTALFLLARSRQRPLAVVTAFVLLALSLGAKSWGMLVPALWLLAMLFPLRQVHNPRELVRATAELAPFWVLALLAARLALWAQRSLGEAMPSLAEHSLLERALQACFGWCFYIGKTLVPSALVPLVALPQELELSNPRFAWPVLLAALACTALWLLRKRLPGLVTALAAATLCVLPVLGFFQAGPQLVADRYTYLFGVPLALLAAAGLQRLALQSRSASLSAWVAGLTILCALGFSTRRQCAVWHNSESLWGRVLEVTPEEPSAALALGNEYFRQARDSTDRERALELLDKASSLYLRGASSGKDPRFPMRLAMVHDALAGLEPEHEQEHRARAAGFARQALESASGRAQTGFESDLLRAEQAELRGEHAGAAKQFEALCRQAPLDARPWWGLARSRAGAGDRSGARSAAERVLLLEPEHFGAPQLLRELDAR